MLRRALPALLAIWGTVLLALALLDWAGYSLVLRQMVLAR
jgi:hypothetical protein